MCSFGFIMLSSFGSYKKRLTANTATLLAGIRNMPYLYINPHQAKDGKNKVLGMGSPAKAAGTGSPVESDADSDGDSYDSDASNAGNASSVATLLPEGIMGRPLKFLRTEAQMRSQLTRDVQKVEEAVCIGMLASHFPLKVTIRQGPGGGHGRQDYFNHRGGLMLPETSPLDDSVPWHDKLALRRSDGWMEIPWNSKDYATSPLQGSPQIPCRG
jgi:hypothetical protein